MGQKFTGNHQWLGVCPTCHKMHNDLDEVVALNMREEFPDPGTSALAIRDVDEPKFHAPSRAYNVAQVTWWAWRVIDWALDPRNDNYPQRWDCMDRAYQAMKSSRYDVRVGDLFS